MKTASRRAGAGLILACALVSLSACGGGGGASSPPPPPGTLSLGTSSVSFKAAGPYAEAPATQTVTGTVTGITSSGTLYITIVASSPGSPNSLFTVSNVTISGNSGQASVIPASPSTLKAGSYQGSITVSACLNDPTCQTGQLAGSPQTIPVSYDVASGVDGDTVTPRVVTANTAGTVILRGSGFTGATSVSFGSTAATSMTVVSDSEIDASYPSLPAGTYPVTIDGGSITDTASLISVSPPAFTATILPYPSGLGLPYPITPEIEYDAQRSALFILLPGQGSASPTLLRYTFDGSAWGSPTQVSIPGLVEVHLSPDGTHLLALVNPDSAHTSMAELDPVTMAQTNVTTVSNPPTSGYAVGFAIANDGNAIVSYSYTYTYGYAFGTFSRVFTPMPNSGCCGSPIASGNGAIVAMDGGTFDASSETVAAQAPSVDGQTTTDLAGDKFLDFGDVDSQTGQTLGYINGLYGGVVNPAGTRVYGVDTQALTLTTYDLTATPTGSPDPLYPALGTPISLPSTCNPGCVNAFYQMAITPDGGTVFIAGPSQIVVQPVPP